jgi:hypothetical protein
MCIPEYTQLPMPCLLYMAPFINITVGNDLFPGKPGQNTLLHTAVYANKFPIYAKTTT